MMHKAKRDACMHKAKRDVGIILKHMYVLLECIIENVLLGF